MLAVYNNLMGHKIWVYKNQKQEPKPMKRESPWALQRLSFTRIWTAYIETKVGIGTKVEKVTDSLPDHAQFNSVKFYLVLRREK